MADNIYPIPDNPVYSEEIRKLQNSDPANAETILNPLMQAILNNIAAVKKELEQHEGLQIHVTADEPDWEPNEWWYKVIRSNDAADPDTIYPLLETLEAAEAGGTTGMELE